jgi:outer membrane protein assembly factor BamD
MLARSYLILALLVSVIALQSCSSNKNKNPFSNYNEQKLYEVAQGHLKGNRFVLAVEALQQLESDFPFGKYANSAQLSLIYAYYRSSEPALAESAAARFIRLQPNHPNVDYAYYLRGLTAFPKADTLFQSAFGSDLSQKDMDSTQKAFIRFSELVDRFPESQYAPDAAKRMEYLRNLLARSEVNVANYYLDRGAYLAAANRGRYVVENFQKSPAVPDALAVMVQSYNALNMPLLAEDSLSILKLNYPEYPALTKEGEFDFDYYRQGTKSLVGALTFGLIDYSRQPGFDTREQYGQF